MTFTPSAMILKDAYKESHIAQLPPGTEYAYATWIPRSSYIWDTTHVVHFGLQAFIQEYLIDYFNENFFHRTRWGVVEEYRNIITSFFKVDDPDVSHVVKLHELGYLPIRIRALPEGTLTPLGVPMFTIENTHPEFAWVVGSLESLMSCEIWQPSTSATLAYRFRKLLDTWAYRTVGSNAGVEFQGHDFSMRGMTSLKAAAASGAAHLLSFNGTDTIPAVVYADQYYNANSRENLIGTSIRATEHSIMSSYGKDNEAQAYRHLIEDVYPSGFVSIVSDTYDIWNVCDVILRDLKDIIMNRDGRVVIRGDSGRPEDIICGSLELDANEFERKGLVEILWEIFGGTLSPEGYKILDPHIGTIYGDAINYDRAKTICERLAAKGFASVNTVFGIGSYTYQMQSRDTFGFALKQTHIIINGEESNIFKDPITDKNHSKRSLTGRVAVVEVDGGLQVVQGLNIDQQQEYINEGRDKLRIVFEDGHAHNFQTFQQVIETLHG